MFIVRWLMSHPILFAWALAALAIILNWGTKSGVDHAEPSDVAAVHSQQTANVQDAKGSDAAGDKTKAAQQAAVEAHTPASPEQPVVPVAPVNELEKPAHPSKPDLNVDSSKEVSHSGTAQPDQNPEQGADSAIDKIEEAPAKESAATDMASVNANVDENKQAEEVTGTPEVTENGASEKSADVDSAKATDAVNPAVPVTAEAKAETPNQLLKAAREAFWHNKKDEAASIYKQLIEMQPEVLEHKGELGNVYWHQNKQKESAALYAEIAIPLIEKGKASQVENMLGFIGAFYPEKATEIHQYLLNNQ